MARRGLAALRTRCRSTSRRRTRGGEAAERSTLRGLPAPTSASNRNRASTAKSATAREATAARTCNDAPIRRRAARRPRHPRRGLQRTRAEIARHVFETGNPADDRFHDSAAPSRGDWFGDIPMPTPAAKVAARPGADHRDWSAAPHSRLRHPRGREAGVRRTSAQGRRRWTRRSALARSASRACVQRGRCPGERPPVPCPAPARSRPRRSGGDRGQRSRPEWSSGGGGFSGRAVGTAKLVAQCLQYGFSVEFVGLRDPLRRLAGPEELDDDLPSDVSNDRLAEATQRVDLDLVEINVRVNKPWLTAVAIVGPFDPIAGTPQLAATSRGRPVRS
jgi:hypothetical protein